MHAFVIITNGHPVLCGQLEGILNEAFRAEAINASARWYYDEFAEGPTEFGVRINASGLIREEWASVLHMALQFCQWHCRDTNPTTRAALQLP